MAKDYPLYNFLLESKGYTYDNVRSLRNILTPHKGVQAYLHKHDSERIVLKIANNKSIPMELLHLEYQNIVIKPNLNKKLILTERNYGSPVNYEEFEFYHNQNEHFEILNKDQFQLVYRTLGTKQTIYRNFPISRF